MEQWEYKVAVLSAGIFNVEQKLELQLNELGEQGWELVSAPSYGYSYYIFKRKGRE